MTKKEFLELADKYNDGNCSEKEKELLFKFCDDAQFKNLTANWDLSDETQIRINLLKRIIHTIQSEKRKRSKTFRFKYAQAAATILIILSIASYYYLEMDNTSTIEIPKNAITLQLEDGTIKVVKENDTNTFFNSQGNVVSKQQGNKLVYKVEKKDSLNKLVYNTLTVPYGKRFELELSDGTTAYLNSGTSIKYPTHFIKDFERKIFVNGEVFLSVAKNPHHPFVVNANHLNVKVLGTKFNVNAYPEDATSEVVLVEGSVALYNDSQINNSNNGTILKPGYKAIFNTDDYKTIIKPVITEVYTSWINGELVFRNMPFENIIKKLERHYDIKIINKNTSINKTIFNASFGHETVEFIFKSLKDNYGINYSITEKVITINK